ncbi:hypothetical protein [Peptoniphilus sp.]|uniref:hypothetical protein n=1 Tax=Peptoniphilus sp. TaxID=1971214 RepID=UPI00399325BD
MKKSYKYIIETTLLLTSLFLCLFKNYLWLPFSNGPGNISIKKYNFIATIPIGYGLFFPMLVVIMTSILLLLQVLQIFKKVKANRKTKLVLVVMDIVFIWLPVIIGMQIFNIGLVYIFLLLVGYLIINFIK